jgi:hypothetical protein
MPVIDVGFEAKVGEAEVGRVEVVVGVSEGRLLGADGDGGADL